MVQIEEFWLYHCLHAGQHMSWRWQSIFYGVRLQDDQQQMQVALPIDLFTYLFMYLSIYLDFGVQLQEDQEQWHMSLRWQSSFSGVKLQEDQEQMHV